MSRIFQPKAERIEGNMRSVYRLTCGSCGVTNPPMIVTTRAGGYPPEMIMKNFRAKGWHVGKRDGDDKCPACYQRAEEQRRRLRPVSKDDDMSAKKAIEPAQDQSPPDPPADLSIDDALLISARLDDIFDPQRGYVEDWTDAKLSQDMGVPRAWVATIRRKRFGKAGENDDIRAFLAEAIEAIETATQIRAAVAEVVPRFHAIEEQIKALDAKIAAVTKRSAEIERTIR